MQASYSSAASTGRMLSKPCDMSLVGTVSHEWNCKTVIARNILAVAKSCECDPVILVTAAEPLSLSFLQPGSSAKIWVLGDSPTRVTRIICQSVFGPL
eukprot:s966_g16.t1